MEDPSRYHGSILHKNNVDIVECWTVISVDYNNDAVANL